MIRRYIAHYYRDIYLLEKYNDEEIEKFAVDECNFTYENGQQLWILDAIETSKKCIRIEIIHKKNPTNLEKFITNYIPRNSTVITDNWHLYSFMNRPNSHYLHIIHSHTYGDFGYGDESTIHIKSLWANLQYLINKMYNMISSVNFEILKYISDIENNLPL